MNKCLKVRISLFIIILSFAYIVACNSDKDDDRASCSNNGTTESIQPPEQAKINPVPCGNNETLAIVHPDGNVYTYDVCQRRLSQLTFDGQPYYRENIPEAGSYYFFGSSTVWSPDGSALLLGKDSVAHIVNVQDGWQNTAGERVLSASWSPDGHHIAVIQSPINDYRPWKVKHLAISVIDVQSLSNRLFFEGSAAAWISNSELIYFSIVEERDSQTLSDVIKVNLSGDHKVLCPQVSTSYGFVRHALLSMDKRYVAVHKPGLGWNLAVFGLDRPGTFSERWFVSDQRESGIGWSPVSSVLAICTEGEGGKDGPLPQTSHGAIWLVGFYQFPKIFNDQRCLSWSRVSWHPSGEIVAFLSWDFKLAFIDTVAGELMDGPAQPNELRMYEGPWWSPSGHYIGIISEDNKVYVAQFNEDELLFEYVMDGVEISWQPLKFRD